MNTPSIHKTSDTKETPKVNNFVEKDRELSGDEMFIPIYGENPSQEKVLEILKQRSTAYKDCKNYEEAMKLLEKNNPDLWKWLNTSPSTGTEQKKDEKLNNKNYVEDPKNQAEIDKALAERGYTPEDKNKGDNTEAKQKEKEKKEAEAKQKKADETKKLKENVRKPNKIKKNMRKGDKM